ncbi:MAG: hypothetical protein QQN41_09145 [Nitrosopumilus sp.]
MDEKKIEILYDHYKDTFENQKSYLKRRNLYTLICLVLIAVISFQITSPTEVVDISGQLIKKHIGDIKIDFSYVNNVLTFGLFWVVIMYFQINFLIEKHYAYIHDIEETLTKELKPFEISREGKSYLGSYPWLSSLVHRIYTVLFPLTLIVVAVIKWFTEKNSIAEHWSNGHFWFNTIFLLGIVVTSLLYLINRYFNDFKKKKDSKTEN